MDQAGVIFVPAILAESLTVFPCGTETHREEIIVEELLVQNHASDPPAPVRERMNLFKFNMEYRGCLYYSIRGNPFIAVQPAAGNEKVSFTGRFFPPA